MGLFRKVISGSAAVATGGLSLAAVQYRSDTERGTRQTKLLREEQQKANDLALAELEVQHEILKAQTQSMKRQLPAERVSVPVEESKPIAGTTPLEQVEMLERASSLFERQVLTPEEFEAEKAKIIAM